MPPVNSYKSSLVSLMNFKHDLVGNQKFQKDHVFTQEQLLAITPTDITRWMKLKVYGTADPGPEQQPTNGRASSLEYAKKAISFFMPNRLIPWNVATGQGNPTKSIPVNDLIKLVKKKEVRGQGKASQARRPMTQQEFREMLNILKGKVEPSRRYAIPGLTKFQFHVIVIFDLFYGLDFKATFFHKSSPNSNRHSDFK